MLTDDVELISVNDHSVEPADMFPDRLPARSVDEGPTVVDHPGGLPAAAFPAGMARLDDIGAEGVLWMSDLPHPDPAAAIAEGKGRALLRLPRGPRTR